MEKAVIIKLTLDEAKELYKSNNEKLRELALKVFSENALDPPSFDKIKSFEDAMTVLGMSIDDENSIVNTLKERSKAMAAMYKLNIIRKVLNFEQDLHFTKDPKHSYIYYPYTPFATENSTSLKNELISGRMEIIGKIKVEGILYNVFGGGISNGRCYGLGTYNPYSGVGNAEADVCLLGCANEKIAKHFGKYFGVLILEAKYGDMFDFEVIEDKYGNA